MSCLATLSRLAVIGLFASVSWAGEPVKITEPASIDGGKPWELYATVPGWFSGMDGSIGVRGVVTDASASFTDVVKQLDMIGALNAELRHRRSGFIFDGLYVKTSVDGDSPGPLLGNVSAGVKQSILEGAYAYRIAEGDRGWIDLLAGARWIYLSGSLTMTVDDAGVSQVSDELSSRVIDRTKEAVKKEVDSRIPELVANLSDSLRDKVEDRVADRVASIKEELRDRINGRIGALPNLPDGPGIGGDIAGSGPVRDAITDYAKAKAIARIEEARAAASPALAVARAAIRARANERLEKAEKKLSQTIENQIQKTIPESELSQNKSWVDPFIGVRARYNFSDAWYAAFRGDVGGFGISSDLTLNLFGALGWQARQNMALELGYRHFAVDYTDGGFVYDMALSGPYLGLTMMY